MLRFQLISEQLGSMVIDKADPIDINAITQTIKRSEEYEGVTFEVVLDVQFIKKARRFIKLAFEQTGGIDAEVLVNIYSRNVNRKRWEIYATGRINFIKYEVWEDRVIVNVEQVGFQRRVLNMTEVDVDLETLVSENGTALPPNNVQLYLPYHSKAILKETNLSPQDQNEYQGVDIISWNLGPYNPLNNDPTATRDYIAYGQFDASKEALNELDGAFSNPYGYTPFDNSIGSNSEASIAAYKAFLQANKEPRFPLYTAEEPGVADINIHCKYKHGIDAINTGGDVDYPLFGDSCLGSTDITYWYEHRDKDNNIKKLENFGKYMVATRIGEDNTVEYPMTTFDYSLNNQTIDEGDKIYVYFLVRIYGEYERPGVLSDTGHVSHNIRVTAGAEDMTSGVSFIDIVQKTATSPSTSKTILIYEAIERCCQYYTNQIKCFKSNLLGRTDLGYAEDGEGALIGITNGKNLRGINLPIISNLKDLLDFVNAIYCIGFGFETQEDGTYVLRLEKRAYFSQQNDVIIDLGEVYDVKKILNSKNFYVQIEYGYAGKVDVVQTNAIDEFNTIRRATCGPKNTKNKLVVTTKFRTGGYLIESQRRLVSKTTDGKLDDEMFGVCVVRDMITGYRTERMENFVDVQNVYDAPSSYNLRISPARCLVSWYQFLAASTVYTPDKKIKWTYGEVNYLMRSLRVGEVNYLAENGNVDLSFITPIVTNFNLKLSDVPFRDSAFKLLKSQAYKAVTFKDLYGTSFYGLVSTEGVEHDQFKGTASFTLQEIYKP